MDFIKFCWFDKREAKINVRFPSLKSRIINFSDCLNLLIVLFCNYCKCSVCDQTFFTLLHLTVEFSKNYFTKNNRILDINLIKNSFISFLNFFIKWKVFFNKKNWLKISKLVRLYIYKNTYGGRWVILQCKWLQRNVFEWN